MTKRNRIKREQLIERDGLYCHYCGIALVRSEDYPHPYPMPNRKAGFGLMTVDHVEPLSKGGMYDLANLVLACYDCNTAKSNYDIGEHRKNMHRAGWRS